MRLRLFEGFDLSVVAERVRAKATILRLGFAVVIALLALSAYQAYQIQQTQSRQAMEIYRRHVDQDQVLVRLRRTLWLASVHLRDYLIDPTDAGWRRFQVQARETRAEADRLQHQFNELAPGNESTEELRAHLAALWAALDQVRNVGRLNGARRYAFVQEQVVPRRNAAGDALREFTEVAQGALRANEASFEASQREASRRLLVLLVCSGLFGLLVAWFSISHAESFERATREQHRAVASAREELKLLTARLMSLQEDERARLSRELHDEIGQALATMRLEVVRTEGVCREKLPEVLDRLGRVRELAERTVRTVRNMSALLRPSVLDDLGLAPAIRSLVNEFQRRTGLSCHLTIPDEEPVLPEGVATCVYRVVQESLHNCEKHARARRVDIALRSAGDHWLGVEISDDGVGFDIRRPGSADSARLGILGMQERAAAVGGTLATVSSPGVGTRVQLRVPCQFDAAAAPAPVRMAE
ncbi:MAG: sensor histidine kinase [Bryobacterales bacterium]|nr:sensor histidine kinase [Bryobacterales bacterium]